MIHKWKAIVVIIFLTVIISGFLLFSPPEGPKAYELTIMKIGDEWKVVDATDHTKTKVKAKRKDKIIWTIVGSDASFQFPAALFDPDSDEDALINGYTKYLKEGKKLRLKVKDSAVLGTYEYAVFCVKDGVFATGDSPPKIMIE